MSVGFRPADTGRAAPAARYVQACPGNLLTGRGAGAHAAVRELFEYAADLGAYPWPAFVALSIGALAMAVFHGMRGAFWLNRVLGKPIPAPVYAHR
ncbi:hypothetical protein AB0H42_12480 [Nocardia sp. NPDC050799]|uniref:hypothetical protein n=1 Tax=Nocardia sp. NPDC050799 TaxID=3154842 RepID=UPI0033C0B24A